MGMRDIQEQEALLKPDDVARRLNVSLRWVRQAAKSGALPYVRVGRLLRFQAADIEDFITESLTAADFAFDLEGP